MSTERLHETLLREHDIEVFEEIGRGGQAVCYRAACRTGQCAIKVHFSPVASKDKLPKKLQREIDAQRDLSGPEFADYVLMMQDYFLVGDKLVTRWPLGSGTLADELEKHPEGIAVEQVVAWFAHLGRSLDAIHSVPWVHADVKPSNIILLGTRPRLCDFGVSRRADGNTTSMATNRFGTEHYVPKCESGEDAKPTRISDFYGFVLCFVQLLQDRHPLGKTKEDFYLNRHAGNFDLSILNQRQKQIVENVLREETVPDSIADWFDDLVETSDESRQPVTLEVSSDEPEPYRRQRGHTERPSFESHFDEDPTTTNVLHEVDEPPVVSTSRKLDLRKIALICIMAMISMVAWNLFVSDSGDDKPAISSTGIGKNQQGTATDPSHLQATSETAPSPLLLQAVAEAKQASLALRDQASQLGVNEFDKQNLAEAEEIRDEAVARAEAGEFQAALTSFNQSNELYQTAIAKTASVQLKRFSEELVTLKAKAIESDSPNLDAEQFGRAVAAMDEIRKTLREFPVVTSRRKSLSTRQLKQPIENPRCEKRRRSSTKNCVCSTLNLLLSSVVRNGNVELHKRMSRTCRKVVEKRITEV